MPGSTTLPSIYVTRRVLDTLRLVQAVVVLVALQPNVQFGAFEGWVETVVGLLAVVVPSLVVRQGSTPLDDPRDPDGTRLLHSLEV